MQAVTTIGLDIAKSVFQVHGVDAEGKVTIRRKLKRRPRRVSKPGNGDDPSLIDPIVVHSAAEPATLFRLN